MEVRDSVHVKTTVSERIGTEMRTTEQQMSANDAFEETQAAVEQRAKQYKRRHKAAVCIALPAVLQLLVVLRNRH